MQATVVREKEGEKMSAAISNLTPGWQNFAKRTFNLKKNPSFETLEVQPFISTGIGKGGTHELRAERGPSFNLSCHKYRRRSMPKSATAL